MEGSADLYRLGRDLGIDLHPFSEEKARDLLQRIRVCDVDGLSESAGIDRQRASYIVHRYSECVSGIDERKVLRTPDARMLRREILSVFSQEASSTLGRNRLLLLTPSLNRETIQNRLNLCAMGEDILGELKQHGRHDDLKEMLANVSFDTPSGKKKQQQRPSSGPISDTLQCFASRKRAVESVRTILSDFEECQKLRLFWKGVDDRGALDEIIKTLGEIESSDVQDADALLSDTEMLVNDELRKSARADQEKARGVVEDRIEEVVAALKMNAEEENALREAAFEGLSIPFEFERNAKKRLVERWEERQRRERAARLAHAETFLAGKWRLVEQLVERAVLLDQVLAVATAMAKYSLTIPAIGNEGICFVNARSLSLVREQLEGSDKKKDVQPVSYCIGRARSISMLARPRNVAMLTGANSGGKTTLLTTLATIHILTLLGLAVPCERAEVPLMPVYLFRRRVTRRIGSLEQALNTLIPAFADRHRKLVLMDEFEALTEPGASGRIIATLMNEAAAGSSLVLIVTHLSRETLPHVKLPIRVDGIEATGLGEDGELIVDRQPKFNHIGSSTPKLIIQKLSAARKKNVKSLCDDILRSLEGESQPVQTPLTLPWLPDEAERTSAVNLKHAEGDRGSGFDA